jgi:hypothetical protein
MNKRFDSAWTSDEIEQAFTLYRFGYSNGQISDKLGRTANAIQMMFRREYAINGNSEPRKYTAEQLLALPALLPDTTNYRARAEVNTAFIISMMRAGHTWGQGEMPMISEARCVPRHVDVSRYSLVGSQAALCAGY